MWIRDVLSFQTALYCAKHQQQKTQPVSRDDNTEAKVTQTLSGSKFTFQKNHEQ